MRLKSSLLLSALAVLTLPISAQDGERALLIVDPGNAESLYVANYYRAARKIPARNVLYMDPAGTDYLGQATVQRRAFLGELLRRGIEDQVDFVILPPGDDFRVQAAGLVKDQCSPVNHFGVPTAFTLARHAEDILGGGLSSASNNHYRKNNWEERGFESRASWLNGDKSTADNAERYFIGGMLGWTGNLGNTLAEVLDMIDRSVATDGMHPIGTVYYCQTNDNARSAPRHGAYPGATAEILNSGGQAQHLFANLPIGHHDAMGVMTGLANPAIDDPNFSLLDGSFADHLTSYAGHFGTNSQTKMSRWITKGASGTAGTVEEPCNYAGKFPHARMHVVYFKGLTLGEAWFRSMGFKPFQELLLGDPLTRPYGWFPIVDLPNPPQGPQSGTIALSPTSTATDQGATIATVELFVDGLVVDTVGPGQSFLLDTTTLSDGFHELRIRAFDDTVVRQAGVWIGELETLNHGKSLALTGPLSAGDLGTAFDLSWTATGGTVDEVLLTSAVRVVASGTGAAGTATVFGQNVGGGPVDVVAEARFDDGTRARSAPFSLDVGFTGGGTTGAAPVAFSYTREVRDDAPFLIELAAAFPENPGTAVFNVLTEPTEAQLLGGSGAWRAYAPDPFTQGTDTLDFEVATAAGTAAGTVTIVYVDADGCPPIERFCTAAPNSAGPGALLDASGSLSVEANDLVLSVAGGPPNQFGLFFYGDQQTNHMVGDGFVCVGGSLWRLDVIQLNGGGSGMFELDITDPPNPNGQITSGSSWAMQFWYRDPGFGSYGFNFSDAFWLTFCP